MAKPGATRRRQRRATTVLFGVSLGLSQACAAELTPGLAADLRRAVQAVGPSASDAAAIRLESQKAPASAGFLLGAALAAWVNASVSLAFDLQNPAAAGPPHASQGPANSDAIDQDCADENTAFDHLQSRSRDLGLAPDQVVHAAGLQDSMIEAWRKREAGPAKACR